ncbi:MAG TPA: tyrosine-type recombinase/integrase [Jatrophihabitans sp.]|nr:tyrosine-type recombinase/integrase [Jatrophihabitans sp.]
MSSIERRRTPNGQTRWYARYRDPEGKSRVKAFERKIDAEKYLTTVEASKLTDSYVDPRAGAITVLAYFEHWSSRQVWTDGTQKAMSLAVRSTTFANVRLRDVRPSHVEQWVKSMTVRGLAPGTIKTRFNNVHAMFRAAVRDRLISSDPAVFVKLPRTRARAATMVIPSVEQVGALMTAAPDAFRPFVALCAFVGLRLGEAAAAQVGDIDFLRRTLAVRRQVQRAGRGRVEIRPPKYGSERTVYLPDELLSILARHIETRGLAHDAWLFDGESGNPPHQNTVGYWWRMTRNRAGVAALRLHDLRHFYASGLIASGCDVVTVQRALGHKSATTTLNTYAHLWPTAEDRTRSAAAQMLSAALAGAYFSCTPDAARTL